MVKQSLDMCSHISGVELREIPQVSNKYVAGNDGHIYCYSNARVNAKKPQPFRLGETVGSSGYLFVAIIEDGKRRTTAVHSLVCRAFHGLPETNESVVRHLDGERTSNRPENLAWGSYAENEADKRRHGRVAEGERHGHAKLTSDAVRIIRASIPFGLWNAPDAAKVFGVDVSTINRIARGERDWQHIE